MPYMKGPTGTIKPILDIYVAQYEEAGWRKLDGQELKDYEMEQAYRAALRTQGRWRLGSVQARPLSKAEQAAIQAWEKRLAEIEKERAAAGQPQAQSAGT